MQGPFSPIVFLKLWPVTGWLPPSQPPEIGSIQITRSMAFAVIASPIRFSRNWKFACDGILKPNLAVPNQREWTHCCFEHLSTYVYSIGGRAPSPSLGDAKRKRTHKQGPPERPGCSKPAARTKRVP